MPASFSSTTYTPDKLTAGNEHLLVARSITLIYGQNQVRGAVLGKISVGAASSAAKTGGNTGNGTLTMDATTPVRPGAKVGVYSVRIVAAALGGGTFSVTDPDGFLIGDAAVGSTFDNDIKFATAAGDTDFIVGDGFDVTVAAGSNKYTLSVAASIDGSQTPDVILAEDCDASGGDKTAIAYFRGDFNENALTLGAGHTTASIREGLRAKGITLIPATV